MPTTTAPSILRGGGWLLESSEPDAVFTPERMTDEHRLIGQTADEFVDKEVLPVLDRLIAIDAKNPEYRHLRTLCLGQMDRAFTSIRRAIELQPENAEFHAHHAFFLLQQGEFLAGWIKFMHMLGIRGQPVGAKNLRQMLLQTGIDPNTNEFSQGIIAMREE